MLFNSLTFLIFLPTVFIAYWSLKEKLLYQNLLILVASYIFYGWWDFRFLSLIFLSSCIDYYVGLKLGRENQKKKRKMYLYISLFSNLGILGYFKYSGFFVDSFINLISQFGIVFDYNTLNIILPVGISFYTFQTLSYTIDIYKRDIEPVNDIIAFFAFVSFFPQLVAGPIERAKNLLPQFLRYRDFNYFDSKNGLKQMLWGFFKKIVIADNVALHVNYIFENYESLHGFVLFIGVFFFAIQIYCDFSGYSDIAVGTAKLFGFNLMQNFAFPYFSRNISEFWNRWHISLSTWFRDYVYIPLGGNRVAKWKRSLNIIITFTISGLWHGANWTFVLWGFLNGLYYLPLMFFQKKKCIEVSKKSFFLNLIEFTKIIFTFILVLFAWIFFRAKSIGHALGYINHMILSPWTMNISGEYVVCIFYSLVLLSIEWFQRNKKYGLDFNFKSVSLRWVFYLIITISIPLFGNLGKVEFIYFQF